MQKSCRPMGFTTSREFASLQRMFNALERADLEDMIDCFAVDVEFNIPFQDKRFWSRASGHEEMRKFLSSIPILFSRHRVVLGEFYETDHLRMCFATYRGDFIVRRTGSPYRNNYVAQFSFSSDATIASWTEYHNPLVLKAALDV